MRVIDIAIQRLKRDVEEETRNFSEVGTEDCMRRHLKFFDGL